MCRSVNTVFIPFMQLEHIHTNLTRQIAIAKGLALKYQYIYIAWKEGWYFALSQMKSFIEFIHDS
jgi:hypothetical protein